MLHPIHGVSIRHMEIGVYTIVPEKLLAGHSTSTPYPVIDIHKSPFDHQRIEMFETNSGGVIEVAVQPKHGYRTNLPCRQGHGILEPSGMDEQPIGIIAHNIQNHFSDVFLLGYQCPSGYKRRPWNCDVLRGKPNQPCCSSQLSFPGTGSGRPKNESNA